MIGNFFLWRPSTIWLQNRIKLWATGLPDIRSHDLRHTFATLMLGWGIRPKVVQERLGHANIGHALGIYSHMLPSIQIEAARKMNEMILQGVEGE